MKAMVLAAGFGTRLRPLTFELPKPAVPVLGRPLVEHTLELLRSHGVDHVVLNLHHLPEALPRLLGDGGHLGLKIDYVHEKGEILGTGGGVLGARHLLEGGTFLLVNGDVLLEPDLSLALALHRSSRAVATMVLRRDPSAERYGAIDVDPKGRVRRLLGRPDWPVEDLSTTMFTGLHILEPAIFDLLPAKGCIIRSAYRTLLDTAQVVSGFIDEGPWVELGTVQEYLEANLALASGQLALRHLEGGSGAWISPDAEVADPSLITPPAVIGPEARIRAPVERVVVWQGATVDEAVHDAVVTPRGVVRVLEGSDL